MRLEKSFHFWFYLCLALASGCLALPSTFFVGWMPALLLVTLVLLVLAWRHEGRWLLSDTAANHLGVFIAIGAAGWILFQVPRSESELIAGGVPWPAGILPHLGPMLMMLLVVKVFRPKKLPDFWVIQTIGLMMVTLAAVLADMPSFGVLLTCYLVSLIWCLALYHPVREQRLIGGAVDANQAPLFVEAGRACWPAPWKLGGAYRVATWTAIVLFAGHVIFLAAPRQTPAHWVARQLSPAAVQALRSGVEPGIDLNRVGRVELSEEIAFEVAAIDAHGGTHTLPANQHWQAELFEYYTAGKWFPVTLRRGDDYRAVILRPQGAPRPARGEIFFSFIMRPISSGGLILAEPPAPKQVGLEPRLDGNPEPTSFFAELEDCDAVFAMQRAQSRRRVYEYGQISAPSADASRFPAAVANEAYRNLLSGQGVPAQVREWTRALLGRLEGLRAEDRILDPERDVPAAAHARVADALCRHLAHSGEFHYNLELRRADKSIDPAADFLLNVKEGHCERYAGALALMLRSVGIPCRVAKGYTGAAFDEDRGRYVVLQNQAHSWVQALVPDGKGGWQWRVLEPTPATDPQTDQWDQLTRWFYETFDIRMWWRQLVVEYTPEQQALTMEGVARQVSTRGTWLALAALAGTVALVYAARRAWRWAQARWPGAASMSSAAAAEASLYQKLLTLLARHLRVRPVPGQTPREFALEAGALLRERGFAGGLSDVPARVVAAYYAARYGQRPPSGAERASLTAALDGLAMSLPR
jgi:hypothetical protein